MTSLVIKDFNGSGIDVESNDDSIQACTISGDIDGIFDAGHSSLIAGNVIAGNSGHGVALRG